MIGKRVNFEDGSWGEWVVGQDGMPVFMIVCWPYHYTSTHMKGMEMVKEANLNGPPTISRSEVAHLIEWSTMDRSDKLMCEVREDVELPDRWGVRATRHVHEYLGKYRIDVVSAGQGQFIGHVREIGSMVIDKKTHVGNLRGVLLQLADSISIHVNKQLMSDWTDEEWNTTAAAANKIMREVADPLREDA